MSRAVVERSTTALHLAPGPSARVEADHVAVGVGDGCPPAPVLARGQASSWWLTYSRVDRIRVILAATLGQRWTRQAVARKAAGRVDFEEQDARLDGGITFEEAFDVGWWGIKDADAGQVGAVA